MKKKASLKKVIVPVITPTIKSDKPDSTIEENEVKKNVEPVLDAAKDLHDTETSKPAVKPVKKETEKTEEEMEDEDDEAIQKFVQDFIKPYLECYPGEKRFHITSDGQVFLDHHHHDAKHHQKSLKEDTEHIIYDVK